MHLLGTSVVAFILLPLVFSCKSTNPKENISLDYKHVIGKQLEHINTNIEKQLNRSCLDKKNRHPMGNATDIHNVSCKRMPKGLETELETDLRKFVEAINSSLGCTCLIQQGEQTPTTKFQPLQRKLCKLKRFLARIQRAYEQFNSAP